MAIVIAVSALACGVVPCDIGFTCGGRVILTLIQSFCTVFGTDSIRGIKVKKYKVMTQKDRMFGGKFNPEKVEEALNSLGQEGWELKGVATAEFPSLTGGRQELVIFLEKDI